MASSVDYGALSLWSQLLTGLFMVINSILNVCLMTSSSPSRSPRRYIIAFMAFANLFLALFTLLVREINLSQPLLVKCETRTLAWTYSSLHSFVTGFSLVMLSVELVFRQNICSSFNKNSVIAGIVLGGAPWIVGLFIILPLHLLGYNFHNCNYDSEDQTDYERFLSRTDADDNMKYFSGIQPNSVYRQRAIQYVSVIIPVCAAFLASVFIKCIKVSAVVEFYKDNTNTSNTNLDGIILQPRPGAHPSAPDYTSPPPFPRSDINDDNRYPTTSAPTNISAIPANQPQHLLHNNPGPTIPANHSEPASNYIPEPTSTSTETQAPYTASQSNSGTEQGIQREKLFILLTSWMYAVMFLPLTIYFLTYILEPNNQMDELAAVIVGQLVLYLNYLWGFFFPIMWSKVLNKKN